MKTIFKFKYLLLHTLMIACLSLASCDNQSSSSGAATEAELFKAFLSTTYPILLDECSACHSDGVYPFASSLQDQAAKIGITLMGTDFESNRFIKKVGDSEYPHPNQEVATRVYDKLESAVKSYFTKVKTGINLEDYIQSEEVLVGSSTKKYPSINNLGFLLFEAEGASIEEDTKFDITSGSFQNSFAITSTAYPINSVSRAIRSYNYDACSSNPKVTVLQSAHTIDKSLQKYSIRINAKLIDPSTGNDFIYNKANYVFHSVDILPYNKPYSSLNDSDYKNYSNPTNWNTQTPLSTLQKQYMFDQLTKAPGNTARAVLAVKAFIQEKGITQANIVNFLKIDNVQRLVDTRVHLPENISIHPKESVPIDSNLASNITQPGVADFIFSIPEYLSFGDLDQKSTIPIQIFTKSTGMFAISIDEINPTTNNIIESSYPCTNSNLNTTTDWKRIASFNKLQRGKSYRMRIHQTDGLGKMDAFLLRVETEENDGDINLDPTLTRFPSYGRYDHGDQKKVERLSWKLPVGGHVEADVVVHNKFYEVSSPIYIPEANNKKNLQLTGIDFIVNGQISKTDRSFIEQGIRPPYSIISYGAVFIPIENGPQKDKISLAFNYLDLTDSAASLPSYKDAPPIEDIACLAPEVFYEKVFPIYTQLPVMLREDYDRWSTSTAHPYSYDAGKNELTTPRFGGQYKCVSCHTEDHPYFPIPDDYKLACNEALSRSNLENPLLSFAIRGLRGQFEHAPLYIMADITKNNNLQYTFIPGTEKRVYYGPQTGKLKSYTLNEIESFISTEMSAELIEKHYNSLQTPKQILITQPSENINPSLFTESYSLRPSHISFQPINSSTSLFNVENTMTLYRDDDNDENIIDQHKVILDKLVASFVSWLEEEKRLRK